MTLLIGTLYGIALQCGFKNKSTFYKNSAHDEVVEGVLGVDPEVVVEKRGFAGGFHFRKRAVAVARHVAAQPGDLHDWAPVGLSERRARRRMRVWK